MIPTCIRYSSGVQRSNRTRFYEWTPVFLRQHGPFQFAATAVSRCSARSRAVRPPWAYGTIDAPRGACSVLEPNELEGCVTPMDHTANQAMPHGTRGHLGKLLAMAAFSFIAMYGLMYAMVDVRANVLSNVNQAYMAALMTAPMIVIELWLMRDMYGHGRRNLALGLASIALGALAFAAIRRQTGIGDEQFLRSMIPHHGGAILMCTRATIRDEQIQRLCQSIIQGQQAEIAQMKDILKRLR
jgi:hypothetical protein